MENKKYELIKLKKKNKIKLLDKLKLNTKDCKDEIYYSKLNQIIIWIVIITIIIFMKWLFKEMIID